MSEHKRLISLDFFRGFTIAGMILVNNPGDWSHIYAPLKHAPWHGWTMTDTIFPFFLFIVGVSISLALSTRKENRAPLPDMYKKIIRRSIILFALGLFLSGFPCFELSSIRIPGVLQRIAVCYFFAAVIFLHFNIRMQAAWAFALLLIYWAFMAWFPVPGVGAGSYEPAANFAAWIDNMFLQGHMWEESKTWDPEGIFSTLPAISTTLFGVLTGHLLRQHIPAIKKATTLLVCGCLAMLIGWLWQFYLPINKSLWTSSYAIFMSGFAAAVLAICYYLIDIKSWRFGTKPFRVYGMNAITVYVLSGIVARLLYLNQCPPVEGSMTIKTWLMDTLFSPWLSPINASLAFALSFVFLSYLAMHYLYIKQIFIKV